MSIKTFLFRSLYFLRAHHFLRWVHRKKIIILMYHGFTDQENHKGIENYQGKHLSIEKFRSQVKFLKEHYNVVALDEVVDHLTKGRKPPPYSVVLTFDDGYRSNHSLAFPFLKEYRVPASIFLTTNFVDQKEFLWPDRLEYAVNRGFSPADSDCSGSKESWESGIRMELKRIPQELRSEKIEALERQHGVKLTEDSRHAEIYRPLSWEEVSEMLDSRLVSVGSHTHTHVILSRCTTKTVLDELRLSREIIEKRTGRDCHLFCYPNGEPGDFDDRTKKLLQETGYWCGLTTVPGFNHQRSNVYELKRFGVRNQMDFIEFVMTLCGVKKFLSDAKQFVWRTGGVPSTEGQESLVVSSFDKEASTYSDAYSARSNPIAHSFTIRRQRVCELLEGCGGGKLLDVGCGPGVMVESAISRNFEFFGVDLSKEMIHSCQKRFVHVPSAHFSVGRVEQLGLPDSFFDVVLCMGVVEYLEDDRAALKEIARILRQGGNLIVTFPNQSSPYRIWDRTFYRSLYGWMSDTFKRIRGRKAEKRIAHREYTEAACSDLFSSCGLSVKDCVYYNFKLSFAPLDILFPRLTVQVSQALEFLCRSPLRKLGTGFIIRAEKGDQTKSDMFRDSGIGVKKDFLLYP